MKPFITLGRVSTPDGSQLTLHEHDGEFYLKLNGKQLMSTVATNSELMLSQLSCQGLERICRNARVLIGGLGLGYSLQRALDLVGRHATIEVAELLPEVIKWNRTFLRGVNGKLLDDPRVETRVEDVCKSIRTAKPDFYDAILLDNDNGPTSFVLSKNARIYSRKGVAAILRALKPGGKVAFWCADKEPAFAESLKRSGFITGAFPVKAHEHAKRDAHMIYVGQKPHLPQIQDGSNGEESKPLTPRARPQKRKGFKQRPAQLPRKRLEFE